MLKPKYVHGLNADEAPQSLLRRLKHEGDLKMWPLPPNDPSNDPSSDPSSDHQQWSWALG